MALDHDLIAKAWLNSAPFRDGSARSTDARTQAAIDALLAAPGRDSLGTVLSSEECDRVLRRVTSGEALNPQTVAGASARRLTRSYASACAVLREPSLRNEVLGPGDLEFDEMNLTPTLARLPLAPEMVSGLRERCEIQYGIQFSIENLHAAVLQVAHERPFHPVRDYLVDLRWDRVERLRLLADLFGAPGSPLVASMLRKFMISAAARALSPGCKVDTTLILVGRQGIGKSRAVRALAAPWFSDTPVTLGDKDSLLVLHSAWIHEWAELESALRARRNETVKAFLSSCEDTFRAPYERTTRRYPRSCIIVGTTNDEQFLTDPTGGRRYWVVPVKRRVDVGQIEKERDQLWAEAVERYLAQEPWHLSDVEERSLQRVQKRHEVGDPWEEIVVSFASANAAGVTTSGVLEHLDIPRSQWSKAHEMRVGTILVRNGFEKRRTTVSTGQRAWVYRRQNRVTAPVIPLEVGHG